MLIIYPESVVVNYDILLVLDCTKEASRSVVNSNPGNTCKRLLVPSRFTEKNDKTLIYTRLFSGYINLLPVRMFKY